MFIGTAGVFAVGYALAVLSVMGTAKVALALLVLGVPIIDTFWIIIRRMSQGRSPFSADRGHLHHRLLDLGLSHRQAVLAHLRDRHHPGHRSAWSCRAAARSLCSCSSSSSAASLLFLLTRRAGQSLERSSYADEPETDALDAIRHVGDEITGTDEEQSPTPRRLTTRGASNDRRRRGDE